MAKLNLNQFKENANKIIQEKATQGLFAESQNRLITLELEMLKANPFPIRLNNSSFETLCESIEKFGQLEPIIICKVQNSYQILDGHARKNALEQTGAESALCMEISISKNEAMYSPFLLNDGRGLDSFEKAYYLERLRTSGKTPKEIQKNLAIDVEDFPLYNFEYNLLEIMQNNPALEYGNLLEISTIEDEALRDETLDHIVQKLINQQEISHYLLKVKETVIGAKFLLKNDGVKMKKSGHKISMDFDERNLSEADIKRVYAFMTSF